jgi:hypothetical protein
MNDQQASQVRIGLVLITIGALFLLGQLDIWPMTFGRVWPFAAIVLGVVLLVVPGERRSGGPWWLILTGAIFVLHTYEVASIRDTWPLFIVATGISVLAGGLSAPPTKKDGLR